MKFEKTEVFNFEGALRGMRNPKNSWDRSDSYIAHGGHCVINGVRQESFTIGEKDLQLAKTLINGGSEHRKFLRQIFVCVDITAPLYWWKEFSTYKVGTVVNSTSTMHKLASTPITKECFEKIDADLITHDNISFDTAVGTYTFNSIYCIIDTLESLRKSYLETKDKRIWKLLIQLLPSSWLQTRTVTMTYENVFNMVKQRKNHKLTEWSVDFMEWAKTLPYASDFIFTE